MLGKCQLTMPSIEVIFIEGVGFAVCIWGSYTKLE